MSFSRRHLLAAASAIAAVVLIIVGVLASGSRSSNQRTRRAVGTPSTTTAARPAGPGGWQPVPPATDVPAQTAVQQEYDSALASGIGSSPSLVTARIARTPPPGFSTGWPALAVASTPQQWTDEFTKQLLGIDFAHQSRAGLARWLTAEEAPELLPGVPASVADKVLYLSLFDTASFGGSTSPVPSAAAWAADASAGTTWAVSDLTVQPDPRFSQMVAAGWEPVDQRFAVEDVSGLLDVTQGGSRSARRFSMVVYVGSAHWHPGYGTVLVDDWKES